VLQTGCTFWLGAYKSSEFMFTLWFRHALNAALCLRGR